MVSPTEWGGNAWALLHGIAERVGSRKHITLMRDEQTYIRMALRHFWALLPCKTCQDHYRGWLQSHPPERFTGSAFGEDLQDGMREWVYRLHEDVNTRREVVSGVTLASLRESYRSVDILSCASDIRSLYTRGVQVRVLKPEEWKVAWRHLNTLIRSLM